MLLNILLTYNKFKIIWDPDHCGVEGNDKTDLLSCIGSSLEIIFLCDELERCEFLNMSVPGHKAVPQTMI